jgi:glutamyl/glutaminyl-tRNA synthetase
MPQKLAIELLLATDAALFKAALAAYDDGMDWKTWTGRVAQATGRKGKPLYQPLRAALTGRLEGPDMSALMPILTPARIRARLKRPLR